MAGELFILSAPSGAGKTTLLRRLLQATPANGARLAYSVSYTAREPRAGEVTGHDYHFVTPMEFERMIAEGRFLEWARVHGRYYGTAIEEVEKHLAQDADVLLDIDVQGARQVRELRPEAVTIFLMPPSFTELERRLHGRGLDDPEEIARRLQEAWNEMQYYKSYEYVIINDDSDRAAEALSAVIHARRSRRNRLQTRIDQVLKTFPSSS